MNLLDALTVEQSEHEQDASLLRTEVHCGKKTQTVVVDFHVPVYDTGPGSKNVNARSSGNSFINGLPVFLAVFEAVFFFVIISRSL